MNKLLTFTRRNTPTLFFAKILALLFFAVAFTQLSFGQVCPNLVTNGDFTQGNIGFTSSFVFGCTPATNCQTGVYCVTPNFQTKCNSWTGGSLAPSTVNFMAVDGFTAGTAPFNIWKQTSIPVVLGKTYAFSFWVKSIHPTGGTQAFNIDMVITPNATGSTPVVFSNPITSTSWIKYTKTWVSTLTGTVDLTLRQPVVDDFYDFGLDDINFSKACDVSISSQGQGNCSLNYNVSATACGTGPFSYQWCNGQTGSNYNVTLPCKTDASFCVTMTDATGCKATTTVGVPPVNDNVPPVITCPANKTINCNESDLPANTGTATATDNCGIKSITYVDATQLPIDPCNKVILRTWTAEDLCGNKSTCSQRINTRDLTPPVITCPPNKTLTCGDQNVPGITGIATATDNCTLTADISITYTEVVNGIADCDQTIIRTWTAKDKCGNISSCVQTIFIRDNIPPVAKCNLGVGVTLDGKCEYQVTTAFVNAGSTDNCGIQSITVNPTLITGCKNTIVTLTVKDICNNINTCTMGIQTTEIIPPSITCPANKTINCDESILPANTGNPITFDACGIKTTTYVDATKLNPCGKTITRIWTTEDNCGNTATCSQTITVRDLTPPVLANCPKNVTVNGTIGANGLCTAASILTNPTATDNCDLSVAITNNAPSVFPSGNTTVTWTATDDCMNTSTCSTIVTVICNDCKCGTFSDMTFRPLQGIMNLPVKCGDTLNVGCEPTFNPIIGGLFQCMGNTCPDSALVNWVLNSPSNPNIGNGNLYAKPSFGIALLGSYFNTSGTYELVFTGVCNGVKCPPCKFYIKVDCNNCKCGSFSSLYYQLGPNQPPVSKNCGDTLTVGCKPALGPIISGSFNCVGNCPLPLFPIKWEVYAPSGSIASGTLTGTTFSLPLLGSYFNTTGLYQVVLSSQCGTQICPPCKFYFKVNCPNPNECGYVQNAQFNLGSPFGDEQISSATNWSGIWQNGPNPCSTADFHQSSSILPAGLLQPIPAAGNFAGFWLHRTPNSPAYFTQVWREGIMNKLKTKIQKNTGCYELTFRVACLRTPINTAYLKVYGVDATAPAPNCPNVTILNKDLFGASNTTVKEFGTRALSNLNCTNNYQTVKIILNTSGWTSDINHIFFTRSDIMEGLTYVAVDSICLDSIPCNTCNCGQYTTAFAYNITNNPISITCNNAIRVKIPCKKVGPNFFIHGNIPCSSNDCGQNVMDWKLTGPSGISSNTFALNGNHFDLNLNWSYFAVAGNYQLEVTRYCGDKPCKCVFNFSVEACPCDCSELKNELNNGFLVSTPLNPITCKRTIRPLKLCPNDKITWQVIGVNFNQTFGPTTGNGAINVTFTATGWYTVCMIATRYDANGKPCNSAYYCKRIFVQCGIANPNPTPKAFASICKYNVLNNANFNDTSNVEGELGQAGFLKDWSLFQNLGDGLAMVQDSAGAFDEGFVTLIGRKNNFAGIAQRIDAQDGKFSIIEFELRNWTFPDFAEGTAIEIRMHKEATYNSDSKLLTKYFLKKDTAGHWQRVRIATDTKLDPAFPYLVFCVQNTDDKNNSIVSLDNIEVCASPISDVRDEEENLLSLHLYPNPNTGEFTLELPIVATEKMKLRVTDLTGRVLMEKQAAIGSPTQQLEMNQIANGLYFIQVVQEGRVIGVERFVKQ